MLNFLGIIYLKCQNDQLFDLLHPLIGWGGGILEFFCFYSEDSTNFAIFWRF